jgi:hypothetical protein
MDMGKTKWGPVNYKQDGQLLVDADTGYLLSYIMYLGSFGTFATTGPINATPEQVEAHNNKLDELMCSALDECSVGQYVGPFYLRRGIGDRLSVVTFMGRLISGNVRRTGKKGWAIRFERNGRLFSARIYKDHDSLFAKRIR